MKARPHLLRSVATIALGAAILVGSGAPAGRAQSGAASLAHTPAEEEALETLENGLLVSARTQAESILRASPDSIVGHYVLGRAYFEAEGSLARGMFHLGRARELFEQRVVGDPNSPFHQELLYTSARLAGQMELFEFQLELLGYHDHLYDPDLIAERCWPLMKLGRMSEARQFAETAVASPNPWQRSAGLNALCAVEGEARTREPYHEACNLALDDARRTAARQAARGDDDAEQAGISVDAFNAALGSAAALRFEDSENVAREGVRRFEPSPANPWRLLTELYLSEGKMQEGLDAFTSMVRWNDRTPASLRDQGRADIESTVALVMLFGGEPEQALIRIDRALERPDRRGLTTDGAEVARGRHALLRRIIRRALRESRAEEASWRGRMSQAGHALSSLGSRLSEVPDDERVVAVLADEGRLVDTLRPYVPGGIDQLSPWMNGELIDVLGPAVLAVALESAQALDAQESRTQGYYLALEAEIAAARGDEARALAKAREALPLLEDPGWALVRARLAATVAQAAIDSGRRERAFELFGLALEIDPGVLRRLGLALPATVSSSGGGDASDAASLVERSPRLTGDSGGFRVVVSALGDGGLRACLQTPSGNEINCADAQPPEPAPEPAEGEEPRELTELERAEAELTMPERLAREVHRQLFGARIALSQIDLSSLDGRTQGGSSAANERLRELMGEGDAE